MKSRNRTIALWTAAVGVLVVVATVAGCTTPSGSDSQPSTQRVRDQAGVRSAFGARAQTISPGDLDIIASYIDLPARWNRAAAPFVRDYLDPNVPPERWVQEGSAYVGELRAVHAEMQAATLAIQDAGIQLTFQEFTGNYRSKLDSVTALHMAVAQANQEAEQRAKQSLSAATAEGQKLGMALLERLRPYIDPQVLTDELTKRGKAIGQLMKPR